MSRISYDKGVRDKAKAENMGLMTLSITDPGKHAGKFGCRISLQGPIDSEQSKMIHEFFVRYIRKYVGKGKGKER